MEKRTILAILLCLAVWLVWQALFVETPPPPPAEETVQQQTTVAEQKPKESAPPKEAERHQEKTGVLETDLYRAEFSSRGAALKTVLLKKFRARDEHKGMLNQDEDLVSAKEEDKLPFRLDVRSESLQLPVFSDWELLESDGEKVVFRLLAGDERNVEIRKTFRKKKDPYLLELAISIINGRQDSLEEQTLLQLSGAKKQRVSTGCFSPPSAPRQASCFVGGELLQAGEEPSQHSGQPDVKWVAIDEQYFIVSAVPMAEKEAACQVESNEQGVFARLLLPKESIAPGGQKEHVYSLFLGPKQIDLLSQVVGGAGGGDDKAKLEKAVDFGWLGVLCHPMLWALKIFFGWTKNYGIAIIILTIIIKILMQPLTSRSMKSMKEMAKLKPLMDELREKYKDDKDKLNQEMMNLYKAHKINPLGGCLPMLLQMPIWIALYRMLYSAVELYQAPFIVGWIDDLSWRDPYFIMPVVLGVAMFLQQKLSPTSADSQQAKIMLYAMPVFFTFIMLYLPSGLVLYILVNSVLSIAQQIIFNRKTKMEKAPAKG